MKLYSEGKSFKLYNGNMLDMLSEIKPNSIDSIVTDPPYELNFMGKGWDSAGISFQKSTWERCFEVLKPGGHMLVFGGSRTFHRIACAVEDAGFEIRDTIMWLYGSGFPKSMNIGLAVDKKNGVESKVVGVGTSGSADTHTRCMNSVTRSGKEVFGGEFEIKEAQNVWRGWGTQLKPSYEPILVCRKPCEGTVVDNVLKYGVGGINIDECRVPLEKDYEYKETIRNKRSDGTVFDNKHTGFRSENNNTASASPDGRFPSNTILTYDETDYGEVCGGMPKSGEGNGGIPYNYAGREYNNRSNSMFNGDRPQSPSNYNDNGSASRYFYCAKASKRDRDEGVQECGLKSNNHPTVKPQSLIQYLIRLVTPPHGIVLDPFTGSGSTGKATMYENADRGVGYKFIGIELDEHYCDIATARISYAEGNPIMLESSENHDEESQRNTLFDL
jgi:site-specific DNA-methyltransferase (adenine-specific)